MRLASLMVLQELILDQNRHSEQSVGSIQSRHPEQSVGSIFLITCFYVFYILRVQNSFVKLFLQEKYFFVSFKKERNDEETANNKY